MISVNTNDVQQSEITFDHTCVDLLNPAQRFIDGRGLYLLYQQQYYSYMMPAFQLGKNINHNHLIFALL